MLESIHKEEISLLAKKFSSLTLDRLRAIWHHSRLGYDFLDYGISIKVEENPIPIPKWYNPFSTIRYTIYSKGTLVTTGLIDKEKEENEKD